MSVSTSEILYTCVIQLKSHWPDKQFIVVYIEVSTGVHRWHRWVSQVCKNHPPFFLFVNSKCSLCPWTHFAYFVINWKWHSLFVVLLSLLYILLSTYTIIQSLYPHLMAILVSVRLNLWPWLFVNNPTPSSFIFTWKANSQLSIFQHPLGDYRWVNVYTGMFKGRFKM